MANYRQNRINDQMAKELADILRTVKDYRVANTFVSITAVDCTKDLKYAKIYFSAIGGNADPKEVRRGLMSAAGYIRTALAQRLNLRITPELTFLYDESVTHGAKIAQLLHEVEAELPKEPAGNEESPSAEEDPS